jgi:hypothetical protein
MAIISSSSESCELVINKATAPKTMLRQPIIRLLKLPNGWRPYGDKPSSAKLIKNVVIVLHGMKKKMF